MLKCSIEIIGANSPGKFAQKSVRTVILDELDKHPALIGAESGPWELSEDRLTAHDDGKRIAISTPTVGAGKINQLFLEGTQHKYHVPCPHCGHFQELTEDRLRYDHCRHDELELDGDAAQESSSAYDLRRVREDTYYECANPDCTEPGGRIDERFKDSMIKNGRWQATNPKALPSEVSMHISALYSPFKKMAWGRLAVKIIKAKTLAAKKHLWNSIFGKPYQAQSTSLTRANILALVAKEPPYVPGTCPVIPDYVSFQSDRQMDVFKWAQFGHLADGTIYIVNWGMAATTDGLIDAFDTPVTITAPGEQCGEKVYAQGGLIDSGYGSHTVYDICLDVQERHARQGRLLFPSRGKTGLYVKELVWFSPINRKGNTLRLYFYKDDDYLDSLYHDRIKHREKSGAPALYFPAQHPTRPREDYDAFLDEFTNEELIEIPDKLGKPVLKWKKRTKADVRATKTLESGDTSEDHEEPKNDWGDTGKMALAYHDIIAPAIGG